MTTFKIEYRRPGQDWSEAGVCYALSVIHLHETSGRLRQRGVEVRCINSIGEDILAIKTAAPASEPAPLDAIAIRRAAWAAYDDACLYRDRLRQQRADLERELEHAEDCCQAAAKAANDADCADDADLVADALEEASES